MKPAFSGCAVGGFVCLVFLLSCGFLGRGDGAALEDTEFNETLSAEEAPFRSHSNNWAVIVDTSSFWYNYRHLANTYSIYRTVKRLGIPDSHIILMTADDMACNPRNPLPGTVFNNKAQNLNVYGETIEVDYRGYEVSVDNFLRVLTGRHAQDVPPNKRLLTDEKSNILIYMTGHGGVEFLKFQDYQEICSKDLADAFEQMWEKKRYNQIFFVVDTCQATTLYSRFRSPNIVAIGSSSINEMSYSHHLDPEIGLAMIDRFTYHTLDFFESIKIDSRKKMSDYFKKFSKRQLRAQPKYRADLFSANVDELLVTDFFGAVEEISIRDFEYPISRELTPEDDKGVAPSNFIADFEQSRFWRN